MGFKLQELQTLFSPDLLKLLLGIPGREAPTQLRENFGSAQQRGHAQGRGQQHSALEGAVTGWVPQGSCRVKLSLPAPAIGGVALVSNAPIGLWCTLWAIRPAPGRQGPAMGVHGSRCGRQAPAGPVVQSACA